MKRTLAFIALLVLACCAFQEPLFIYNKRAAVASGPAVVQPTSGAFWGVTGSGCGIFAANPTTCDYPSNVTSGNGIYIHVTFGTTGTLPTPTSSGTATIGAITAVGSGCNVSGSTCGGAQQWYHASVTGSGSLTISVVPPSSNNMAVMVWEVSNDAGADTGTNPVYALNNSGCTTGCAIVSITPATTGDLIICDGAAGNAATLSAFTPQTLISQDAAVGNNLLIWGAQYIAPSTSAVNGTYTTSSVDNMLNGCIAIK